MMQHYRVSFYKMFEGEVQSVLGIPVSHDQFEDDCMFLRL